MSMYFKHTVNLVLGVTMLMVSCKKHEKQNEEVNIEPKKPNIILIMADDLGYGELSSYGSTKINTPNIDKLASQGVKFLDFHSNGPVCSPTRAALMTGKYQQRTGVEGVITAANHREVGLSLKELTLAEELQNLGYATAMFGKWHLGYAEEFNPTYQGFETFTGFVGGNIDYHSHIDQEGYLDWWKGNIIDDEKGYTTDLITSYGVNYIKNNNPKKTGKPFFLYLSQEAPHYPIQGRYDKPVREEGNKKYIRKVAKDSVQMIYTHMIETMDEGIGEIMKTVNAEDLNENTMIIFCSDNGAAGKRGDNGGLRDSKASVYEGGHRVPLIISYPNQIKANSVSNAAVMSMDFLPTLVDIAGGKPTGKNIDGINFKSHLFKGTKLEDRKLYWVFGSKKAIRDGDWKLVTNETEGKESVELFNLKNDLSEKQDLSANEPVRVKNMLSQLENWQKEVRNGVVSVAK
ncbi:MAG: sulfatase-like hydrolase/transferase [Algibacter sp.]|uniref:sulfatase-like hydrolase/transferase n=1 Tax=Algibacter sp. TaxID=1872428 RepID=UPI003296843A